MTLDLTSRIVPVQSKKGFVRLEHDIFAASDDEAEKEKEKEKDTQQQETPDPEENATHQKEQTAEPEEQDRIQIVGLHDNNPIVSYQGQIYSCQWASTIGTDLLFTKAPEDQDDRMAEPLRKLGSFDMIGASSARLVATTAKLRPRSGRSKRQQQNHTFAPIQDAESMDVVKFPVPEDATRGQKRQAGFLEQLSAVKARLGEKDKIRASAYTSRGANMRPGEDDGTQGQTTFVTATSPDRSGDYTFITEDGSDPPSPRRSPMRSPSRQTPTTTRARRSRRGSAAARPRRARRSQLDSPLRNELRGEAAGPSAEGATPSTWDELGRDGAT